MTGLWFWDDDGGVSGRWYELQFNDPKSPFSWYYGYEIQWS